MGVILQFPSTATDTQDRVSPVSCLIPKAATATTVWSVIPARRGSKGIPQKNLCLLAGKTLVERAVETALCVSRPENIIVTTDYEPNEIPASCRPFWSRRPPYLATDDTAMVGVLRFEAARRAWGSGDTVILIQPSSVHPNRSVITTQSLEQNYAMTGVKYPTRWHPFYAVEVGYDVLPRNRQGLPDVYRPDGLVYIIRDIAMLDMYNPYSGPVLPTVGTVTIDTLEDLREAERVFSGL